MTLTGVYKFKLEWYKCIYWRASKASETLLGVTNGNWICIWRVSEASETLSGVYKFELVRYICISYRPVSRSIVDK